MDNSENKDIRWEQRFSNFNKAFVQFERFLQKEKLNEMENQGLIKAFEYTFELAWKTLQDLLKERGYKNIHGPKPVIQQSFQDGYIADGKGWMKMLEGRNLTSHTYDEDSANKIIDEIRDAYYKLLRDLKNILETLELVSKEKFFKYYALWN